MLRTALMLAGLILLAQAAPAQEAAKPPAAHPLLPRPPERGPLGAPNLDLTDAKAVLAYVRPTVERTLRERDPSSALVMQQELERLLARLPMEDAAQRATAAAAAKQIQLSREKVYEQVTPLAVLMQKVKDNLDDQYAVYHLGAKLQMEVFPVVVSDPDAGAKTLADVRAVFDLVEQAQPSEQTKRQLDRGKLRRATARRHALPPALPMGPTSVVCYGRAAGRSSRTISWRFVRQPETVGCVSAAQCTARQRC